MPVDEVAVATIESLSKLSRPAAVPLPSLPGELVVIDTIASGVAGLVGAAIGLVSSSDDPDDDLLPRATARRRSKK